MRYILYVYWYAVVLPCHIISHTIRTIHRHLEESLMSRKVKKARRKEVQGIAEDKITMALEEAIGKSELTREEVNYCYSLIEEGKLKGLGNEPSFGKPWWKKLPVPDPRKLKAHVFARIQSMKKQRRSSTQKEPRSRTALVIKRKS